MPALIVEAPVITGSIAHLRTIAPATDDLARATASPLDVAPLRVAVAGECRVSLQDLPATPIAGGRRYVLEVESKGARSLSFAFAPYRMPLGAELRLVGTKGSLGPFTASDAVLEELWTPILEGETVRVELDVPHRAAFAPEVLLSRVHHGFRDLVTGPRTREAGSCHVDASCVDDPALEGPIRSVGLYVVQGTHTCTGQLLAATESRETPFFLTADHCGVTSTNAHTVRVYWDVSSPVCGARCCGDRSITQAGAAVRARHEATDTCLLELMAPPPAEAHAYLSGWDARPEHRPSRVSAIHHPSGSEKAVSTCDLGVDAAAYLSSETDDGTHLRVARWDAGATEPGSSGSGLWDDGGRLIGQLHGGYAACGNTDPDWYGRLARAWEGDGTPGTRLRDWLDPDGTSARTSDGRWLGVPPGDATSHVPAPPPARIANPAPNPTAGAADVSYTVEAPGRVTIDVVDVAGRRVATLVHGAHDVGAFSVRWNGERADGRRAAPGLYVIRVAHDGRTVSGTKVTLRY